jgi:hypothetical protein
VLLYSVSDCAVKFAVWNKKEQSGGIKEAQICSERVALAAKSVMFTT